MGLALTRQGNAIDGNRNQLHMPPTKGTSSRTPNTKTKLINITVASNYGSKPQYELACLTCSIRMQHQVIDLVQLADPVVSNMMRMLAVGTILRDIDI